MEWAADSQMNDEQKLTCLVSTVVDCSLVWREIQRNEDVFSSPLEFDGGLTVQSLIKKGWSLEDFEKAWVPGFPDRLRMIRNGIVHSRERRMAKVISPTRGNAERLRPWLAPLGLAAMLVVLYWDVQR